MKDRTLIAATLALGGLVGLTAGASLTRAHAAPPAAASPELAADVRLTNLEQKVTTLQAEVKLLEQQRSAEMSAPVIGTQPPTAYVPGQRPARQPAYTWLAK